MIFFPNHTVAHPRDVRENTKRELRTSPGRTETADVIDHEPWDVVDLASWESFPASDPPPWTLGYDRPPVR